MSVNSSKNEISDQNSVFLISIFNTLLVTTLLTLLIWYMYYNYSRRAFNRKFSKIPRRTRHLPFLGVAHLLLDPEKRLEVVLELTKNGTPTANWMGPIPVVVLDKPDDIKIVLNSPKSLSKSFLYDFAKTYVGSFGLFLSPVPVWKVHRKAINPTFNQKSINLLFDIFRNQADTLLNAFKNETGRTFDVFDKLMNWSLSTVCETVMGVKFSNQYGESVYGASIKRGFSALSNRMSNIFLFNDFIYFKLSKDGRQAKIDVDLLNEMSNDILNEKNRIKKSKRPEAEITDEKKMKPFLDLFLELNIDDGKLSDQEVKDEMQTLLVAGADTSATTLGFILLILGIYPDIQQKMFQEIFDMVGSDREITLADLPQFKYLERVIKETMRLFPAGPIIFRSIDEELNISNYTLPKGSSAAIVIYTTHRLSEYWPDPLKFDPDRFLPEEIAKRNPYSYVPFSGGPRSCIAIKYAMMSLKIVVATLVRQFQIDTHYQKYTDIKLNIEMTLKAVAGVPIKLIERNVN